MRSRKPKVLHELCGLPMVLWPVRAALAAGAGRVVVVDSPARALAPVLPEGVELAVQPVADGTGGAVAAHVLEDPALMLGVNDRVALAHARELAQDAIHRRHLLAGVDIVDPRATVIDVDVQIGQDTTIEPFTTIKGRTRIGAGCTVRHSYLVDCLLEDGVSVGPFAYLRPDATLRSGAKAGTFVEVKNSDIGAAATVQ